MKLRDYRYHLFSHILWGNKKQHYKRKWKEAKLRVRRKMYDKLSKTFSQPLFVNSDVNEDNQKKLALIDKLWYKSIKSNKPVVIYTSYFDYYSPLQQRPNHMFNIFADKGYPCIMCSTSYSELRENLFLIPYAWLKEILKYNFPKVLDIPYGFPYHDIPNIFDYMNKETLVLYELIDDFDLLERKNTIKQAKEMFSKLVKRKNTYVFTSADKLRQIALDLGANPKKTIMNKNAVNLQDFQITDEKEIPPLMQKIMQKNKPIIGYYGALTATWFDFDLVLKTIKQNPQMEFILMGLKYQDKNIKKTEEYFKKLEKFDNFTYIPPVPYNEIPNYARHWSVATIPFQINDITLGTSPVKLFEYMAMGLPIVTTPMPECKLYKTVFIADGEEEFSAKLKQAIESKDDAKYQKILAQEASENTWEMRVNDMINIIEKHHINLG